jgi:methionyl-tRNA synthetase
MTSGQPDKTPFYITTAISYVNGPPHLGHAYEAISTDVIARFKRLDGYDVMFLTGTDEHGQKVEKTARAAGKDPKAFSDEIAALFKEMVAELNISNDDFIRTTEPRHYEASQGIWRKLEENGDIYLGKYKGWYSIRDEAYYDESELVEVEPGQFRGPTGTEVDWVEEESYFFRLSAYQDKLLAHYEANPGFIRPDFRRNEVMSFVKQGLRDLSVSRTNFDWGVPVPGNPDHVMYVWLDALTNYITAVGYPDEDAPLYRRYWPADVHIIGKDIVRFHAIYWPAFLMSAGVPLPKCVFGHGFLNLEGAKMSKSLGNVVTHKDLIAEFGLDQVRYFLMREVPYGQDGSFSREAMIHRINGDLANDLGNLAQRVLSMIAKNCGGKVPARGAVTPEDEAMLAAARGAVPEMRDAMEGFAIHRALEALWRVIADCNRYLDAQAPWTLRKTDPERMASVLWVAAETVRHIAVLAQPATPGAMAKLLDQLAVPVEARDIEHLDEANALVPGTALPKPEGIFPRFVEPETAAAES